ncbi:MAG: cell envelope integrity protein CreD [Alphaproteobacteria bacterium]
MFAVGILMSLVTFAVVIFCVIVAVRFGIQWVISDQLPLLKKQYGSDEQDIDELAKQGKKSRASWGKNITTSPITRLILIAVICLAAIIPLSLLKEFTQERGKYAGYALLRVSGSWGSDQLMRGPAIWIPYEQLETINEKVIGDDGIEQTRTKSIWQKHYRAFLPDVLDIATKMESQNRYSGIYPVPVYTADIQLKGKMPKLSFDDLRQDQIKVDWASAVLVTSVSDNIGLKEAGNLSIGEQTSEANSGLSEVVRTSDSRGFHYGFLADECSQISCEFSYNLKLNGTDSLKFAPMGKQTNLTITSPWPHPSFLGQGLPDKKDISEQGFNAYWQISNLVRSYSQVIKDAELRQFNEYTIGVGLVQPVNPYSMTLRAVKYGLFVIGVTLIGMFVFEQSIQRNLHIVQYLVVTAALSLFYLTLLSLSEHLGFNGAWIAASIVIITMVSIYIGLALKSSKYAIGLAAFMAGVYTVMYALLRLEDYALLVGTVILLIIMVIVMNITRKLTDQKPPTELTPPHL